LIHFYKRCLSKYVDVRIINVDEGII